MLGSVGVVGAGPAGAGVATALAGSDIDVSVFEARAAVGGRAATNRRDGCTYDVGANYLSPDGDGRIGAYVDAFGEDGLVDIERPVWTFDAAGTIEPGDPDRADRHRWTYRSGLSTFVRRALSSSAAAVSTATPIRAVARHGGRWHLAAEDGAVGTFDAVVLTPPGPVTAGLLEATSDDRVEDARRAAAGVAYRPVASFALHVPFRLDRPYYGLVNVDRDHDIGWLSRESCKEGHVPDGEEVLICQMSPSWTADRDGPPAAHAEAVSAAVARLLGDERLADPDWIDAVRWARALPDDRTDPGALAAAAGRGVWFAGDWTVGRGRVAAAFLSGVDTGRRIVDGP